MRSQQDEAFYFSNCINSPLVEVNTIDIVSIYNHGSRISRNNWAGDVS